MQPQSEGGTAITPREFRSALNTIVLNTARGPVIDGDDFVSAKKVIKSRVFQRAAQAETRAVAQEFIDTFERPSPKKNASQKPSAVQTTYEPGRMYSVQRMSLPPSPNGYAWSLAGLDPTIAGHVFARLIPFP